MPKDVAQGRAAPASPHRFGIHSLSGRMLVLLLVPLVVTQFLVFGDLGQRRSAAAEAAQLVRRIGLMSNAGSIYGPAAFEEMTSLGLATVDQLGVDRSVVATALGFDYQPYLTRSRSQLDRALDVLADTYGSVVLADGHTVAERMGDLRIALSAQRTLLDQHRATSPDITGAIAGVTDLVDELVRSTQRGLATAKDADVAAIANESLRLVSMLQAVTTETRANAAGLGALNGARPSSEALGASGVAQFTIQQYGALITSQPSGAAAWQRFVSSAPLSAYDQIRPQIAQALAQRTQVEATVNASGQPALITDPALIRQFAQILQVSFDRLEAFERFATTRFANLTSHATSIGEHADHSVTMWIALLVIDTLVSLVLLALTLLTTLRPLRRLTARALDVGRGQIPADPLPVSGPSDVRAVTVTFNTMVNTLASFESQLAGLAAGQELVPAADAVTPGSLGESLRGSVRHLSDVTTRLRESEALATAIVDTANDAIWTIDQSGRVLSANAAGERILDIPADLQVGSRLQLLFGGRPEVIELSGEMQFKRADGTTVHALISQSEVRVENRVLHAVFARDISERKRLEERLVYQAHHDMLTGLPNRLATIEHLDETLRRSMEAQRPVGVLFIDLDGFKAINDGRGHASGDQLLREVARRLRRGLRDTEFVGRLGGDEFLVVTEGLDLPNLITLGHRLILALAQPFQAGEDLFVVSATAGAALSTQDLDGLELIRQADVAVYHAKSHGRGRLVVFDDALQVAVAANAEIEIALRGAIMSNELELHFQPVLDLRTGEAWGAEALVRWNRPGYGQLAPDSFIPVAEKTSLIIDLDRWVIHQALRTLAAWQRDPARRDLHLAVNVSGRHLTEGDLVGCLRAAVLDTGADPSKLELEITETHLLADLDRANGVLRTLREWGIDVAVDDFGTGYSSMSYLRELEIDTIKIDRVFVARTQVAGYDRTIVEVLLQLAAALGLNVVAEGVETSEQLDFLQDENCNRVQGYYLARPMSLEQVTDWFTVYALEPVG